MIRVSGVETLVVRERLNGLGLLILSLRGDWDRFNCFDIEEIYKDGPTFLSFG